MDESLMSHLGGVSDKAVVALSRQFRMNKFLVSLIGLGPAISLHQDAVPPEQ